MTADDLNAAIELALEQALAGDVIGALRFLRAETGVSLKHGAREIAACADRLGKPVPPAIKSACQ